MGIFGATKVPQCNNDEEICLIVSAAVARLNCFIQTLSKEYDTTWLQYQLIRMTIKCNLKCSKFADLTLRFTHKSRRMKK
jgi:hypothetical protein